MTLSHVKLITQNKPEREYLNSAKNIPRLLERECGVGEGGGLSFAMWTSIAGRFSLFYCESPQMVNNSHCKKVHTKTYLLHTFERD